MNRELDELDRKCAEARGWTFDGPFPCLYGCDKEGVPCGGTLCPRPTSDGGDFLRLLLFHAEAKRPVSIGCVLPACPGEEWYATVAEFIGIGETPGEALARATVAWKEAPDAR